MIRWFQSHWQRGLIWNPTNNKQLSKHSSFLLGLQFPSPAKRYQGIWMKRSDGDPSPPPYPCNKWPGSGMLFFPAGPEASFLHWDIPCNWVALARGTPPQEVAQPGKPLCLCGLRLPSPTQSYWGFQGPLARVTAMQIACCGKSAGLTLTSTDRHHQPC